MRKIAYEFPYSVGVVALFSAMPLPPFAGCEPVAVPRTIRQASILSTSTTDE